MANILILFTIVVLDPFKWLDYDKINTYIISGKEIRITVYEGNKCLERDGCYSNDLDSKQIGYDTITIPMLSSGRFSFDDLFNQ